MYYWDSLVKPDVMLYLMTLSAQILKLTKPEVNSK